MSIVRCGSNNHHHKDDATIVGKLPYQITLHFHSPLLLEGWLYPRCSKMTHDIQQQLTELKQTAQDGVCQGVECQAFECWN